MIKKKQFHDFILSEHQEVEKDPASTNLEHLSRLTRHRPDSINVHVRKTDIICTIGNYVL